MELKKVEEMLKQEESIHIKALHDIQMKLLQVRRNIFSISLKKRNSKNNLLIFLFTDQIISPQQRNRRASLEAIYLKFC